MNKRFKTAITIGLMGAILMASNASAQNVEPYQYYLNQVQEILNSDMQKLNAAQKVQVNRRLEDNLNNDSVVLMGITQSSLSKNTQGWASCQSGSEVLKKILSRSRTFQGLQVGLEYSLMLQMIGCPRTGMGSAVEPLIEGLPGYLSRVNDAIPAMLTSTKEQLGKASFQQEFSSSLMQSLLMDPSVLCLNEQQARRRASQEPFEGSLQKSYQACGVAR